VVTAESGRHHTNGEAKINGESITF